jgi:hypothetical protein
MEMWEIYELQYGVPVAVMLGLLVGIIILAIYVHTRSMAHLAVMGIYALAIFSTMWASNAYFESQINIAWYVVAVAIASVIVMLVLRMIKE